MIGWVEGNLKKQTRCVLPKQTCDNLPPVPSTVPQF
jgi:hypothetical protein